MKPEQLEELANRIDHEELWRLSMLDRDNLTQDQRDRLDAGINLRRYAHDRGTVIEVLKEGQEYIRGFKLERANNLGTDRRGCGTHNWHAAINNYSDNERIAERDYPHWMYTAKMVSDEVPRMILLFERERQHKLGNSYKMCAHDPRPATPLPDNHLRCVLGQECRKCPHLSAIKEQKNMTPEAKDEAMAWTCATHIMLESKLNSYFETFLHDKSDAAFDERLADSISAEHNEHQ